MEDEGMEYLMPGGATEAGPLSQEPSLAVGQEGQERAEVVWEGWGRWWLGKGNLLASSAWFIWDCQHVAGVHTHSVCSVSQVGM